MSEFLFGLGSGHLSIKAARAAKSSGATLVNHTDPGCSCGEGCLSCKRNRRHWFAGPNYGAPHDGQLADRVMHAVRAAATKADAKLLDLQGNRQGAVQR